MDLGVYNVSYIVGLFGSRIRWYTANMERGIDTSGVLTMEYRSFKAVSINAKDCAAPARYHSGHEGLSAAENPRLTTAAA